MHHKFMQTRSLRKMG
uniref:Uncharacterized protein n=1 Tax=Rhizophora mucronata TaxID=61149 RepID=A0A2P2N752_RHIMU